jgi:molecular chaperone GrpE (heat shock protein)
MNIKNTFNLALKNSYISKGFFSSSKEKDGEKKEKTEEKSEKESEEEKEKEDSTDKALNEKYKELKVLYNEQELKLEQTRKKFHEIKELYLKNIEEIDAIKSRSDREIKNSKDYAITKFAKDLLDVHDNFTRALGVISDREFKTLSEEENIETFDNFVEGKIIVKIEIEI